MSDPRAKLASVSEHRSIFEAEPRREAYGTILPPDTLLEQWTPEELATRIRCGEWEADLCANLLAISGRARGGWDLVIGEGLAYLREGDRLAQLGFHFDDYAREALRLKKSTAERLAHVATGLRKAPLLRAAVASGKVLICAAEAVLPVAKGAAEAEWVERASKETVRALKVAVRAALKAAHRPTEDEEEEWLRMRVRMRPDERKVVDEALEIAGEHMPAATRSQKLEAMAQEFLGALAAVAEEPGEGKLSDAFLAPRPLAPVEDDAARAEELERETERWANLPGLGPIPAPKVQFHGHTPVERVDRRLRMLVAVRERWDDHIAFAAGTFTEARLLGLLGFTSLDHLSQDWLGLSPKTVSQRVRLQQQLWTRPALQAAKDAGLSLEKLRVLSRLPDREIPAWAERAKGMTCIALRRAVEGEVDRRMFGQGKLGAVVTRSTAVLLSEAIDTVRKLLDREAPAGECLALIAQHFMDVWEPVLKPAKTRSQKVRRRDVYCQVPGCKHRAAHAHHKEFKSHGGSDDEANLIGLCPYHHHRCIHAGYLRIEEKDGVITWWLKGRVFTGGVDVT